MPALLSAEKQGIRFGGGRGEEEKAKGYSPREQSLSQQGIAIRAFALADAFLQMEEELAERVLVLERGDPERREEGSAEKWQGLIAKISGEIGDTEDREF